MTGRMVVIARELNRSNRTPAQLTNQIGETFTGPI